MERRFICVLGGGGVRCVSQMYLLDVLEQTLGSPLSEFIDLFSGVSGGAIACIPLAFPGTRKLSAAKILEIFVDNAPWIQRAWQKKFGAYEPWVRRLHNLLYPQLIHLVSDRYAPYFEGIGLHELDTEVVLPIFDLLSEQPYVFTRQEARENSSQKIWVQDLLEATAAAPTLLPMKPLVCPSGSLLGCDGVFAVTHPLWLAFLHGIRLFPETRQWTLIAIGAGNNPVSFKNTSWRSIGESAFVSTHITHHFLGYHDEKAYQASLPEWDIQTFFFHPPDLERIDFRDIRQTPQILELAKRYYQEQEREKVTDLIAHLKCHGPSKGS